MADCDGIERAARERWHALADREREADAALTKWEDDADSEAYTLLVATAALGVGTFVCPPLALVGALVLVGGVGVGTVVTERDHEAFRQADLAAIRAQIDTQGYIGELLRCQDRHGGGCGSEGGPGWRLPDGKCASWDDVRHGRDR